MDMMEQLSRIGIVPVIAINDAADAVPLAQALIDGGLPCAEVTFRTAAAADAIKNMTEAFPDMVVGAGTVLTCEQVDRAVAAGAKFIVSPGLNPTTVKHCQEIGIPVCPGTANPSDIEVALSLGLKTVKFFPAEAAGLPLLQQDHLLRRQLDGAGRRGEGQGLGSHPRPDLFRRAADAGP